MARRKRRLATPGQVAVRVRELRKQRGLSLADVLEKLNAEVKPGRRVSRSYLMKLEKGRVNDIKPYTYVVPSKDGHETHYAGFSAVVGQLAFVLGVQPKELLSA